jgi:hypothetical protein
MSNNPTTTPKTTNKPAHEIRLNGIHAAVWANTTDKGVRYNTTFRRDYKDGEEWKTSDAFGRDDLLALGFVASEALRWIMAQKQTAKPAVQS